jgi:hypothetical protein
MYNHFEDFDNNRFSLYWENCFQNWEEPLSNYAALLPIDYIIIASREFIIWCVCVCFLNGFALNLAVINFIMKNLNSLQCNSQSLHNEQQRAHNLHKSSSLHSTKRLNKHLNFAMFNHSDWGLVTQSSSFRGSNPPFYSFNLTIRALGIQPITYTLHLSCYNWTQPYKFTFPDIDEVNVLIGIRLHII